MTSAAPTVWPHCEEPAPRGRTGTPSSAAVASAFAAEIAKQDLATKVDFRVTGCHGYCNKGPNVVVGPGDVCYFEVKPEDVAEVVADVYAHAKGIPGLSMAYAPEQLRFFQARFEPRTPFSIGGIESADVEVAAKG